MTITLITGGNRGLGFEAARQLVEKGHDVIIGARDAAKAEAAAKKIGARFVQLDVTDAASVAKAARSIDALDVLINNAGISGGMKAPLEVTVDDFRAVYETNVFGVVRVTQAMLPLLGQSKHPVIVNVGSGLGSFTTVHQKGRTENIYITPAYASSKSALSMLTVQYARSLPGIRVNVVDPGYTATEFNGYSGPQTIQEGTEAIVRAALGEVPSGAFIDRHGPLGW